MSRNKKSNVLQGVQKQYQSYPYPFRDPYQERERLIALMGSSLAEINHWLFQGKETFSKLLLRDKSVPSFTKWI